VSAGTQAAAATAQERARAITEDLREAGELGPGDQVSAVSQLSGGWSRHSFVAEATKDGAPRRYIVRAEAPGGVLETDIAAEYELYHALNDAPDVATPRAFTFAATRDNAFGNRYIVMEAITGDAANTFRRPDRAWLEEDWNGPRGIAEDMATNLAAIHRFDTHGLGDVVPRLGYLDVVDRWEAVYLERRLVRDPVTEEAVAWLRSRVPADTQEGLVHGDYRTGNVLVDRERPGGPRVTAVLDWELAYVGDVRFDLGYMSLERLAGKHLRPQSALMNAFTEEGWFLDRYGALTGHPVDPEVMRTFAVLAIMMLLSTHYLGIWMYAHGESTDFRLAWNRFGVIGLRQDLTHLMGW
jgi:aminoglycoside phosphotransferase (APT) family kinase protein